MGRTRSSISGMEQRRIRPPYRSDHFSFFISYFFRSHFDTGCFFLGFLFFCVQVASKGVRRRGFNIHYTLALRRRYLVGGGGAFVRDAVDLCVAEVSPTYDNHDDVFDVSAVVAIIDHKTQSSPAQARDPSLFYFASFLSPFFFHVAVVVSSSFALRVRVRWGEREGYCVT